MGFRDDGDAQRAHILALQQELAQQEQRHAQELEAARQRHAAELAEERTRREALQGQLDAARAGGRPPRGSSRRSQILVGAGVIAAIAAVVALEWCSTRRPAPRSPATTSGADVRRSTRRDARVAADLGTAALAEALASQVPEGGSQAMAFAAVAVGAHRRGAEGTVKGWLARARASALQARQPHERAHGLFFVGCAESAVGHGAARATRTVDEGQALLGVTGYEEVARLHLAAAQVCVEIGEHPISGLLLERARAAAAKLADYARAQQLIAIVRAHGARRDHFALAALAAGLNKPNLAVQADLPLRAALVEGLARAGRRAEAETLYAGLRPPSRGLPASYPAALARAAAALRRPDARERLTEALEAQRTQTWVQVEARHDLAVAYALTGDLATARQVFGPSNEQWGVVLVEAGRLDEALALKEYAYTGYRLSLALSQAGRVVEAGYVARKMPSPTLGRVIALTMAASPPSASAPASAPTPAPTRPAGD